MPFDMVPKIFGAFLLVRVSKEICSCAALWLSFSGVSHAKRLFDS